MENNTVIDNQNIEQPKLLSFVKKWAMIGSLAFILNSLISHVLKEYVDANTLRVISQVMVYGLIALFIILIINDFKKSNEGFITFGEGFKVSFFTFLIIAVITTIFTYIYFTQIVDYNSFLAEQQQAMYDKFKQQGLDEKQIAETMKMSMKFMSPEILTLMSFLGLILLSTIFSLIISAIMSKSRPKFI